MKLAGLYLPRLLSRDLFKLIGVFLSGLFISACEPTVITTSAPTQTPILTVIVTLPAGPTETPVATLTAGPTATPTPSITVLSPNGGEEWTEGQMYSVTWSAVGVDTINIEVATGGKPLGHIAFDVPAAAGEYIWTIPEAFVSGFGPPGSDVMRVRIYDSDDPNRFDENDEPFSVLSPQSMALPSLISSNDLILNGQVVVHTE